jgi:gluconate 2-dehydrogenase gamma chain
MTRSTTVLSKAHYRTLVSAMDRIIPPDNDPGAKAAGAPRYLAQLLAGPDFVFAKPDGSGFLHLTGKHARIWRARLRNWRSQYRGGLSEADRRARARSGQAFANLGPDDQDLILMELSHDPQWTEFFELLLSHTREGYYGDPIYGGNLARAGWRAIGFDGPSSLADVHSGHYSTQDYFQPSETPEPGR